MRDLPKSYVLRIVAAVILTVCALTMALSIESILHTTIAVHHFLMVSVTLLVFSIAAFAIFLCWRASMIDVLYTVRKVVPLALTIFPIYVFVFQGALFWMWAF